MTVVLDVLLNNVLVGTLTQLSDGQMIFSFDDSYFKDQDRPVLSQSYYSEMGELLIHPKAYRVKAPPFFSNLLPEGPLREYLAKRGDIKPNQEFKLLRLLGEDLPGAVIIRPSKSYSGDEIEIDTSEGRSDSQIPLRFSLAGVQLKFSGLIEQKGGITIPTSGIGGNWIIKLPAADHDNVPENEFAMMHMAKEIGIPVPEIKLVPLNEISGLPSFGNLRGSNALAVKRFDRGEDGSRTHIEDFAQVFDVPPDKKYEGVNFSNITQMIWTLCGEKGLQDFIKRLAFTILTGNGDMHLKNWSFIYKDGRTPELSPAYDMVSTVPYIPNDTLALKILRIDTMALCDIKLFEHMAERAGVPKKLVTDAVKETSQKTKEVWHQNKKNYDLPSKIEKIISGHMSSMSFGE
tara:strand:- start:2070 stop:3281 length:1212 start_codon:yes stop_codon:yes gene_type:complete